MVGLCLEIRTPETGHSQPWMVRPSASRTSVLQDVWSLVEVLDDRLVKVRHVVRGVPAELGLPGVLERLSLRPLSQSCLGPRLELRRGVVARVPDQQRPQQHLGLVGHALAARKKVD